MSKDVKPKHKIEPELEDETPPPVVTEPVQTMSYDEEEGDLDSDMDDDFYVDVDVDAKDLTKDYNMRRDANNMTRNSSCNSNKGNFNIKKFQPGIKLLSKFEESMWLDEYEIPKQSGGMVNNPIRKKKRHRGRDKRDRPTVEMVLGPRVKRILLILFKKESIKQINGCISTGKKSNVYHGYDANNHDCVIKIFKKVQDEDKYASAGQLKCQKDNIIPLKMAKMSAEKELTILLKLYNSGLPVPKPILLSSHVLLMEFLGTNSIPAPLLKDAELSESKAAELYEDLVLNMWTTYRVCNLVHMDLSELNILYHEGKGYITDVSEFIATDNQYSLDYLRKNCTKITDFFRKKGVPTMTVKETFHYIFNPSITETNRDSELEKLKEIASKRDPDNMVQEEEWDERLFNKTFFRKTRNKLVDVETDFEGLKIGEKTENDLPYVSVLGLKPDLTGAESDPKVPEHRKSLEDESSENNDESQGEDDCEAGDKFSSSRRPKNETAEEKKLRKKNIKEAKSEKRKTKLKKHIKKRAEKENKRRK